MARKKMIYPRKRLAHYEAGNFTVDLWLAQRLEGERLRFEIITAYGYLQLAYIVVMSGEDANRVFKEAKRKVAVEIAKVAMGVSKPIDDSVTLLDGNHRMIKF